LPFAVAGAAGALTATVVLAAAAFFVWWSWA
jgi:hypothetical protein